MELLTFLFDAVVRLFTYHPNIAGLVLADPASITALATIGSAAGGYFGNKAGAEAQAGASKEALQQQRDTYNTDLSNQYSAGQYANSNLPTFNFSVPDPNQYFGTGAVNTAFDASKMKLNQDYGRALTDANITGGQQASYRGLANPSLMQRSYRNDVQQNFAPQFLGLEANRANAMLGQQGNLFQALFGNAQYGNSLQQNQFQNKFNLASQFGNPTVAPTYMSSPANNTPALGAMTPDEYARRFQQNPNGYNGFGSGSGRG